MPRRMESLYGARRRDMLTMEYERQAAHDSRVGRITRPEFHALGIVSVEPSELGLDCCELAQ
jgi:hypothetical protein